MWMLLLALGLFFAKCGFVCYNNTSQVECRSQSFSSNRNKLRVFCHQFNTWTDFNKYFIAHKSDFDKKQILELYSLKPSTPLLLTNQLDMPQFADLQNPQMFLYNLKGLDVFPWYDPPCCYMASLRLYLSTIDFNVNQVSSTEYTCNRNLWPSSSENSLFSYFADISFDYGMEYPAQSICSYLFKNATIDIELQGQVNSFLYTSLFRFQDYNISDTDSINSMINEIDVFGYNYKIDTGLLNPLVFEQIEIAKFYNTIASIQTDVFKYFSNLTSIFLYLDNAVIFYHKIGIEWINYLRYNHATVEIYTSFSQLWDPLTNRPYTYPDSDLCLFASFPANKSISFIAHFDNNPFCGRTVDCKPFLSCTSTI
jgi:hypothetical protein